MMTNDEPQPFALDCEVIVDMIKLAAKSDISPVTQVNLRTNGNITTFAISDYYADLPPVEVESYFIGANGTKIAKSYRIRLNLTVKEFYEKLIGENGPGNDVIFNHTEETVRVKVLPSEKGLHISLRTLLNTVYEGGPAQS